MAESFAFSIGEQLLEKLQNISGKIVTVTIQEICLAWGVKSDLEKLKDTFRIINAVLLDAEEKQALNHELRDWLAKLKNAYYNAEDVSDEVEVEALKREALKRRSVGKKVSHFFSCSNPVPFAFKMGHKMKSIGERLDEIAALKDKFHLVERHGVTKHLLSRESNRESDSSLEPNVIGLDVDKENIIEILLQQTYGIGEDIPILPIVGIGGPGKTALAKLVFNDERIDEHFQLKIWVCVSEDSDLKQLRMKSIKSAGGENCSDMTNEQLFKVLRRCLDGRRYLLILDDVCSHDIKEWIERDLLIDRVNGSKIIVTTRSNRVADLTGTLPQYNLKGLTYEESLSLFLKLAFTKGSEKQHLGLVKIAEDVIKKCKGVPLHVKTLASQLCFKTTEDEWKRVRDNEIWVLEQEGKGTLPALKLSYDQLPSHLKRCFASCSVFPKDYDISNIQLISFWAALGLLISSKESEVVEDVGKRCLRELWARSFFQDFQETLFLIRFKMHDLLHDLALWQSEDVCSMVKSSSQDLSETITHLSIVNPNILKQGAFNRFFDKAGRVRTIFFQHMEKSDSLSFIKKCVSKCPRLRVLDLTDSSFEEMPGIIRKLKHLRDAKLTALRTLVIALCPNLVSLPHGLKHLTALQVLFLWGCEKLTLDSMELDFQGKQDGSLQALAIGGLRKLVTLPQWLLLGSTKTLQQLIIVGCQNLTALPDWFHNVTSLQLLMIAGCPRLSSLPDGMQHLAFLNQLGIEACPTLSNRCKPGIGEDWAKIAHVHRILLGGIEISSANSH